MGQTISCCLGTEDNEPTNVFKKATYDETVPSTPSMADSHFFQSIGEHELFVNQRLSDSSLVESILSRQWADTPRTPHGSLFNQSTPSGAKRVHSSTSQTQNTVPTESFVPTLTYSDDADDEGPNGGSIVSEGTDDTLEEPAQDIASVSDTTSNSPEDNNNEVSSIEMKKSRAPSESTWDSDSTVDDVDNNQTSECYHSGSYTVTVKRFFPIEDKFEITVCVFDDELSVGRQFNIIRDRSQVSKYHEVIEKYAEKIGVDCPRLPYTKKQDRQHGREMMNVYVQGILRTPQLRDAKMTLRHFHIIEPKLSSKGARAKAKSISSVEKQSLQRNLSGNKKRLPSPARKV